MVDKLTENASRQTDMAFRREELKGTVAETFYAGALSYMRRKYTRDLAGVDLAIMGVPFDLATGHRPGARFGPRAIREASAFQAWDPSWWWGFDPFEQLAVADYGDCCFDYGHPESIPGAIADEAFEIISQGPGLLSFGGDHFVTYPLLQAHHRLHGKLSLVHFDAHTDTWPAEKGRIDHGTMFYHAIKEGLIDPATSIQIGIRTTNEDSLGVTVLDSPFVHRQGVDATIERIHETVAGSKCYVTFDIDCLDPCFAPGTGTPVAGGLSTYQCLEILRGLKGLDVAGMDVVEVAPAYDTSNITGIAASSLAASMICLYASRPKA